MYLSGHVGGREMNTSRQERRIEMVVICSKLVQISEQTWSRFVSVEKAAEKAGFPVPQGQLLGSRHRH